MAFEPLLTSLVIAPSLNLSPARSVISTLVPDFARSGVIPSITGLLNLTEDALLSKPRALNWGTSPVSSSFPP